MAQEELDEFGIPIRKKATSAVEVDEFGIPVKKKTSGVKSISPSPTSSTAFNPSNPFNSQSQADYIGPERVREVQKQMASKDVGFTVPNLSQVKQAKAIPKVQAVNEKIIGNVEGKGTDVKNSLGASLGDMYEGIAKIPRYVYDLASVPQNYLAEKLNAPEWKTTYDDVLRATDSVATSLGGIQSPLSILDRVGDYYAGKADQFKEKQVKYDDGIVESLSKGKIGDAGSQIVNNIVASAPSMIMMAMTDGAGAMGGLGAVPRTAVNALPFASSKSNELRDDNTVPASLKPIISGLYGLSEVVFDQSFGTQAIIRKIQKQVLEEGADVALNTGKEVATGFIKKAFQNIKEPLTDVGKNALEEMATQFSQNLVDKVTTNPDKDLMEGVLDAGVVGGVMGGGLGSISAVIGKSKENIAKKTESINQLTADLDNPSLPENAKEVISDKIGKLKEEVQSEIDSSNKEFEALDERGKEEYIEKGAKIDAIEKSMNAENLSEEARAVLTEQKKVLEKELGEIKPVETVKPKTDAEYFDVYESAVKEAKSSEEAFNEVTKDGAVLSDTFNRKYNPDGSLTPLETFGKFYDEIKQGASETKGELNGNLYTDPDGNKFEIFIIDGEKGKVKNIDDVRDKNKITIAVKDLSGKSSLNVGNAGFWKDNDGKYYSNLTNVDKNYRKKGIATAMYDFAKNNGLDIKSSAIQTEKGNSFANRYFKEDKTFVPTEEMKPMEVEIDGKKYMVDRSSVTDVETGMLMPLSGDNDIARRASIEYEKISKEKTEPSTDKPLKEQQEETIEYTERSGKQAKFKKSELELIEEDEIHHIPSEGDVNTVTLKSKDGNKIGEISFRRNDNGTATPVYASLGAPSLYKSGMEKILYEETAKFVKNRYGLDLASGFELHGPTEKMWQSLVRDGKAELIGEEGADRQKYAYKYTGDTKQSLPVTESKIQQQRLDERDLKDISKNIGRNDAVSKGVVKKVFNTNKDMKKIGTEAEYQQYLNNIFPDTKLKGEFYHGTDSSFDKFDHAGRLGTASTDKGYFGQGTYFTLDADLTDSYGKNQYIALINSKKPFMRSKENFNALYGKLKDSGIPKILFDAQDLYRITQYQGEKYSDAVTKAMKDLGFDSSISSSQVVVFDTDNIHIIGNKSDIEGFRKFVDEQNTPKSRTEEIKAKRQSIKDKISQKLKDQRGNLSSGFDPSLIKDFIDLGATYIEEGVVTAKDFIERFRKDYRALGLDDKELTDADIKSEIYDKIIEPKEEPQVSGIKKKLVSDDIIANVDINRISDAKMQELGERLVESGEIIPRDIVDEIAGFKGNKGKPRALQPKEVVALIYYKATLDNKRRELLKEFNSLAKEGAETSAVENRLAKLEDDIMAYDVMSVITAQQQSMAFRLRKGLLDKDYNLVTQIEQYKKTNGGEIPADVLARFKELDRELKEVKDKLAEAEKKALEKEESQALYNIIEDVERSSNTRKSPLTPKEQARKAELAKKYRVFNDITRVVTIFAEKDFREYAKLVLKEAKGEFKAFAVEILKTVGIDARSLLPQLYEEIGGKETPNLDDLVDKPYVRESDGELVVPEAYIRNQVEKGITDIDKLAEAVKSTVAEDIPDITIREVRDAITKYGKQVNQTSDEIQRQINEAKRLGRLYSGLEDLQEQGSRAKAIRQRTEITAKEKELQRQIDILENGLPKTPEEIRGEARKKYLQRFIKEKQERLATKNFAPKQKLPPVFRDSETIRLETEAQKIRDEYDAAHYENEQANRPKLKKFYDVLIGWGTGIQRTLQAGLDASAFLVQGAIAVMSQNPAKTAQAIAESWRFLVSEKYESEFFAKLKAQPDYQLIKDSGLALNYPNSKLGSRDYQLQGSEINKIWKYLVATPFRAFGDKAYQAVLKANPYRATERSFTGAIDTLRLQMFREFADVLRNNGITYESSPEQYKIAANAVNNMTFRGRLRNLEGIAKELSVIFFAPRKIAATLSLTNPYYWGNMMGQSPTVAKRAMFKMASFIALAATITLAVKAFREDDDEDENPDVFNPLSPDFMKLRIGNTRLDFFGGMNQNVILFARMLSGKYKTSTSRQVKELGSNSFVPTRWELGNQFFANKFAPTMALGYRWMNQSAGRKLDWDDEAVKGFMPIWTQNVKELYKEHPATMASFLTGMAFFGQNMSTYGGAEFLKRGKDDKLIELVQKKGASFSTKTRSSLEVIDKKTLEKRGLTSDEYKEYKEDYGQYIRSELKQRYKELEKMPVEKFEKTMASIKSAAANHAEEKISGVSESLLTVEKDNVTYELTPKQVGARESMNRLYLRNNGATRSALVIKYIRSGMDRQQAVKKADKAMLSMANSASREVILKRNTRGGKIMLKEK